MGDFLRRCKENVCRTMGHCFGEHVANIALLLATVFLLIAMLAAPSILVALALLALFLYTILYG